MHAMIGCEAPKRKQARAVALLRFASCPATRRTLPSTALRQMLTSKWHLKQNQTGRIGSRGWPEGSRDTESAIMRWVSEAGQSVRSGGAWAGAAGRAEGSPSPRLFWLWG